MDQEPPEQLSEAAGTTAAQRLAWARSVLLAADSSAEDRARAEGLLLDHVDRLEAMLEHTKDMITVLGQDGTVRFSNSAAGILTGHTEDVNSSNATEYIHPEDIDRVIAAFDACAAQPGATVSAELRIRHADGSWHYVDAYAENCLEDHVGGVVVSMRDICERKEAEASLHRANDSMRDFIAIASHDLRSPVAVVTGLAGALIADWDILDDPGRRELAEVVARSSERMGRLVDNLLIVSQLDAGVSPSRARDIVLRDAVLAAVAPMEIAEEVTVQIEEDLVVHVDPSCLERILTNYLHNAANHGTPPVRVTASRVGTRVEIRVTDSGRGVPKQFVTRLFERFSRAEGSETRGTGLGLSIVRDLARGAGGDAWYEGRDSRGACFVAALPVAPDHV